MYIHNIYVGSDSSVYICMMTWIGRETYLWPLIEKSTHESSCLLRLGAGGFSGQQSIPAAAGSAAIHVPQP